MSDPYAYWSPARIAEVTGCPEVAVRMHWPLVVAALERLGIGDRPVQVAAIGTIAIETASQFSPVREAFWLDEEWRRENLRYYPYYGRGHIQLTWESNYRAAGEALGVDLVGDPNLALDPKTSADILAWYFNTHGGGPRIPEAARRGDWREVRRLVQGGSAGLDRFVQIVTALDGGAPMTVRYDKTYPAIAQNDPWSCAPTSTRWALHALGRRPTEAWIESQMIADGVVSKEAGLLDASGAQLAAWIKAQYGEFGYDSNSEPSISFDWALAEGGHAYPFLVGGRAWNHWSAVRDARDGALLLMNPADGWMGVGQIMTRDQFGALGPFSAVRVWHPDLLAPAPAPPAPPTDTRLERARAKLLEALAVLDEPAPVG